MKSSIYSAVSKFISTGYAVALTLGLCLSTAHADDEAVASKLGYQAIRVESATDEEGAYDTVIKKDGKEIARVSDARPVSFSPDGTILLLCEAAADDDCRHFLLNVAAGEKPKQCNELKRIGGRYVVDAVWSKDGKTITFTNDKDLAEEPTETVNVTASLAQASDK